MDRRDFLKAAAGLTLAGIFSTDKLFAYNLSPAQVTITPATLPFNFSEQLLTVTYTHQGPALTAGQAIYFRANFYTTGGSAYVGLQSSQPANQNYVLLAPGDNATSATLDLNVNFSSFENRIIALNITGGSVQAGESVTVTIQRCCSMVALPGFGVTTEANEQGFWCVTSDPNGKDPEPNSGVTYSRVASTGGYLEAGAAVRVVATLPTLAQAGQSVELKLALVDDRDNLVKNFVGSLTLTSTDPAAALPASVSFSAGDLGVRVVGVTFNTPGVRTISVGGVGSAASGSNPTDVKSSAPLFKIAWGDYHNHSVRCDGMGEPAGNAAYARDVAHLDWYCLTSHDRPTWPLNAAMMWSDIAATIDAAQVPGKFVTIPAFEWSAGYDSASANNGDGHRVVLVDTWDALLPIPYSSDPQTNTSAKLVRTLLARNANAIVISHNANAYLWWKMPAADWAAAITDPEREQIMRLVEICSAQNGNSESEQEAGWRTPSKWGTTLNETAYVVSGYMKGVIAGLMASGDNHAARPGSWLFGALTAVITDDFSRAGIFAALRQRHTYASTGARVIIEFSSGGAIMGDLLPFNPANAQPPTFSYRVATPEPITRLRLVRVTASGAQYIHVVTPTAGTTELQGSFQDVDFNAQWPFATYYLALEFENSLPHGYYRGPNDQGDRAWTSPIFLRAATPSAAKDWNRYE